MFFSSTLAALISLASLVSASTSADTPVTEAQVEKRTLGDLSDLFCLFGICSTTDYSTDIYNCGSKGKRCSSSFSFVGGRGATCVGGVCGASCTSLFDYNWATRRCQDVSVDSSNCGKCGRTCSTSSITGSSSTTCSSGTCKATACTNGWSLSNGICTKTINLLTDPSNCGSVGHRCSDSLPNSISGNCMAGVCSATCKSGFDWDFASRSCQDVSADTSNCGKHGQKCSVSGATLTKCSSGLCSATACATGFTLSNGACTAKSNHLTDPLNCGAKGHRCSTSILNSLGATCTNGVCAAICKNLFDWNSVTKNCQDVSSDNSNCGKCGQVCSVTGASSTTCQSGVCKAKTCLTGYTLLNGACTKVIDLLSDPFNCGSAGNVCKSSGFSFLGGLGAVCENGKCGARCSSLFDYNWVTGKCQDVSSDSTNCGRCGRTCSILGASSTKCTRGNCSATGCYPGYNLVSGTCVPITASHRARLARDNIAVAKRSLCPTGESPCPILGSASYEASVANHFSGWNDFAAIATGAGGFECLDTTQSLDSCGGCASTGEGKDCSKIPGAMGVGCDAGSCIIFSCKTGWRLNLEGSKCVRALVTGRSERNSSRALVARRHRPQHSIRS